MKLRDAEWGEGTSMLPNTRYPEGDKATALFLKLMQDVVQVTARSRQRSSFVTKTVSPDTSDFISRSNSRRPLVDFPDALSLKILPHPAAFSASTWAA